ATPRCAAGSSSPPAVSSPAPSDLCAEGQGGDIDRSEVELVAGHLAERLPRMQLIRAGPLENRRELVRGLVEDLGALQDFLSASHQSVLAIDQGGRRCARLALGRDRFVRGRTNPPAGLGRVGQNEYPTSGAGKLVDSVRQFRV